MVRPDGVRQWVATGMMDVALPFAPATPPLTSLQVDAGSYRLTLTDAAGVEHAASVTVRDGEKVSVKIP